jgi:hypothetical protein
MKVVLAEKPSVGLELASFLGAGTRADGYSCAVSAVATRHERQNGLSWRTPVVMRMVPKLLLAPSA